MFADFFWAEVFVVSALGGRFLVFREAWSLFTFLQNLAGRTCELFQWHMCHMCIPSNTLPTGFHDLAPSSSEFHNSWQHSQCSHRCRRYSLRSLKKIFEVNEEFDHDTLVLWVWLCRKQNRKHGKVCLKRKSSDFESKLPTDMVCTCWLRFKTLFWSQGLWGGRIAAGERCRARSLVKSPFLKEGVLESDTLQPQHSFWLFPFWKWQIKQSLHHKGFEIVRPSVTWWVAWESNALSLKGLKLEASKAINPRIKTQ